MQKRRFWGVRKNAVDWFRVLGCVGVGFGSWVWTFGILILKFGRCGV